MPRFVSFDTETYLIRPGLLAPPMVCGSFAGTAEKRGSVLLTPEACAYIGELLAFPDVVFVGHNVAYDFAVVAAAAPGLLAPIFAAYAAGRVRCTQIREALDAIATGNLGLRRKMKTLKLAALAERHLGIKLEKENTYRLRYAELDGVPLDRWPAEALDYARLDAETTRDVFFAQGGGRDLPDEQPHTQAAFALQLMGVWGIRTDGEAIEVLRAKLGAERAEAFAAASASGFFRADGTKNMEAIRQAVRVDYANRGDEPPATPGGEISTAAEILEACADPGLAGIASVTHLDKIESTYLQALEVGAAHTLCPGWNVLVDSGRTSCGDPNLQNLPRDAGIRECVVPRPGHVFVSVDYDTLELRCLAQSCLDLLGWSKMADALNDGRDLHLDMGAGILGIEYAEALERRKDPAVKEARQLAKAANFGLPGGMGARNFEKFAWSTYRVKLDGKEGRPTARALIDAYHRRWPEVARFFDRVKGLLGPSGEGSITLPRIGRERGGLWFTEACNYLFQGPAASGAKLALFRVSRACYAEPGSPLYGSRPVVFAHDEIIMETPEARLDGAARELARIMISAMREITPDVQITASPAAMRRWYKGAEAVHDAAGCLVPWEPKVAA